MTQRRVIYNDVLPGQNIWGRPPKRKTSDKMGYLDMQLNRDYGHQYPLRKPTSHKGVWNVK